MGQTDPPCILNSKGVRGLGPKQAATAELWRAYQPPPAVSIWVGPADRTLWALLLKLPPRLTRLEPVLALTLKKLF